MPRVVPSSAFGLDITSRNFSQPESIRDNINVCMSSVLVALDLTKAFDNHSHTLSLLMQCMTNSTALKGLVRICNRIFRTVNSLFVNNSNSSLTETMSAGFHFGPPIN